MTDLKKLAIVQWHYAVDIKTGDAKLPDGEMLVCYSDYTALAQEVETLREQLARHEEAAPQEVWIVSNKTSLYIFSTKQVADAFVASFPASVGGGFGVYAVPVRGTTPQPASQDGETKP